MRKRTILIVTILVVVLLAIISLYKNTNRVVCVLLCEDSTYSTVLFFRNVDEANEKFNSIEFRKRLFNIVFLLPEFQQSSVKNIKMFCKNENETIKTYDANLETE
ncbi:MULTISPECIES: hypothetical protein [Thermodesulfovibrio]|jgi:hypothetical protein|uniref:hypothetical protein n=1 Tax=Thermodesulfovibrio TaxID=28261 RepID=UPI00262285B2|nr:hypothetical protein [Thermodesulfovibrio sp.]